MKRLLVLVLREEGSDQRPHKSLRRCAPPRSGTCNEPAIEPALVMLVSLAQKYSKLSKGQLVMAWRWNT
jgi:hypothetical protein